MSRTQLPLPEEILAKGFDLFGFIAGAREKREFLKREPVARQHEHEAMVAMAKERLERENPVAMMSAEEFEAAFRTMVACDRLARGGALRGKTSIEMGSWLDVLDGKMELAAFNERHNSLWDWDGLIELKQSPMAIFAYMRMAKEAALKPGARRGPSP